MGISVSMQELLSRDPDFAKHMGVDPTPVKKDATVGDVHVASTGKRKKPKKKPVAFGVGSSTGNDFDSQLGKALGKPPARMFADILAEASAPTGRRSFVDIIAESNGATEKMARVLKPHKDGGAHSPFPHDANALGSIPDKHVRRFMAAVTNPDDLDQRKVSINSLVAIQPRISPSKVDSIRENGADKLPVVVRHNGKNIIADGTHRAAASWLDGESQIDVKYLRLAGDDDALAKEWSIPLKIVKSDDEKQMIFGWASVVVKDGALVIDKQDDMILPDELESAAYDYVLEYRDHGDSHREKGTGNLVESMVFTQEKQDVLGIRIKDADGHDIVGWWTGFKVNDAVWAKHKSGDYLEFSIGGTSAAEDVTHLMNDD